MPSQQQMIQQAFEVALRYLLFERKHETPIRREYDLIVRERHTLLGHSLLFDSCEEKVCNDARHFLGSARDAIIELNPFSAEMMKDYVVELTGNQQLFRLSLLKRSESRLVEKPAASSIVAP